MKIVLVYLLLFLSLPAFTAADYAREKRWADEITPNILVGDSIYLTQKNQHKFLGLYAKANKARIGVVVVHGMGIHPDWGMVGTLRQRLYDLGFTTLSIQMPVLAADAKAEAYTAVFPEAAERLQLAVAFLKEKEHSRIVIVSHSNGSRMSRVYMATNPADVNAWVALSLTQGDTFDGVKSPILDLYGEKDLPHVLSSVAKRKASLKDNATSTQVMIPNADHFFDKQETAMVKAVKDFLDKVK